MPTHSYVLPADMPLQTIQNALEGFCLLQGAPVTGTSVYCDSFDWRLHGKQMIARLANRRFCIQAFPGNTVACCRWRRKSPPRFWRDLPPGAARTLAENLLDMRALMPVLTITEKTTPLRIQNQDAKTVVRGEASAVTLASAETIRLLCLQGMRGYDRELRACTRALARLGLNALDSPFFLFLCQQAGIRPGAYCAKVRTQLQADMHAAAAVVRILRDLFHTMTANEHGMIQDIDSEFVHDFRVAVRRTRSALTTFKQVFAAHEAEAYKNRFRQLGKATNAIRDLDVYLLTRDTYMRDLPAELRNGLGPFFTALKRLRARELRRVKNLLASQAYVELKQQWPAFLQEHNDFAEKNSRAPILPLAQKTIWKRYRKIIKMGTAIRGDSPDADLHALRIECKKLRYLMEFTASLFAAKPITRLIKALKAFQDGLGLFNDYCVQKAFLLDFIAHNSGLNPHTAAALGGLIVQLQLRKEQKRSEFAGSFKQFNSTAVRGVFAGLFKPRQSG